MKKIVFLFFAFFALSFQSVKSEQMYVGIDYLNNKIDTGVTNISSNLDEKDNGYSLYTGLSVSENMDLEVSYNNFGEASLSGVIIDCDIETGLAKNIKTFIYGGDLANTH